ncbi:MAG: DUF721 domain-containing protein [Treponema sp.]|nr:DUF721 domain-containing protein [Treponema sp.]
MTDDAFISINEMILNACQNIEKAELERNNKLLKTWRTTLESIRSNAKNGENLGTNLYTHSRIIDLKNDILLVEADHPAWIQTLRLYQKYILTGLKRNVPELKISSLAFRLRGTNAELHSQISEEKARSEIEERVKKEEEALKNFDREASAFKVESNNTELVKKSLPKSLQETLDRLKNEILNDEK